jgi:hypothetical protein
VVDVQDQFVPLLVALDPQRADTNLAHVGELRGSSSRYFRLVALDPQRADTILAHVGELRGSSSRYFHPLRSSKPPFGDGQICRSQRVLLRRDLITPVSNVAREATLAPPASTTEIADGESRAISRRTPNTHEGKPQADDARSPLSTPLSRSAPTETSANARRRPRGGRLDLLVDPSSNLSTKYTFLYPGYISFPELACMPQRYPDPDRGHSWALLESILLFLSELVDAGQRALSVSPTM